MSRPASAPKGRALPSKPPRQRKVPARKRSPWEALDLCSEIEATAAFDAVHAAFPSVEEHVLLDAAAKATRQGALAQNLLRFILVQDFGWNSLRDHPFGADNWKQTRQGYKKMLPLFRDHVLEVWLNGIRASARANLAKGRLDASA